MIDLLVNEDGKVWLASDEPLPGEPSEVVYFAGPRLMEIRFEGEIEPHLGTEEIDPELAAMMADSEEALIVAPAASAESAEADAFKVPLRLL